MLQACQASQPAQSSQNTYKGLKLQARPGAPTASSSSQNTYKGLKQALEKDIREEMKQVRRIPIRAWNTSQPNSWRVFCSGSQNTYKGLKLELKALTRLHV